MHGSINKQRNKWNSMISLKDLKHTHMCIYIYIYVYIRRTNSSTWTSASDFVSSMSKPTSSPSSSSIYTYIYMCVYDYMYVHIYIHRLCVCASICACIMDHEDLATSIFACIYIYIHGNPPMTRTSCRTLSNQFKWKCSFLIFKSCLIKQ